MYMGILFACVSVYQMGASVLGSPGTGVNRQLQTDFVGGGNQTQVHWKRGLALKC